MLKRFKLCFQFRLAPLHPGGQLQHPYQRQQSAQLHQYPGAGVGAGGQWAGAWGGGRVGGGGDGVQYPGAGAGAGGQWAGAWGGGHVGGGGDGMDYPAAYCGGAHGYGGGGDGLDYGATEGSDGGNKRRRGGLDGGSRPIMPAGIDSDVGGMRRSLDGQRDPRRSLGSGAGGHRRMPLADQHAVWLAS